MSKITVLDLRRRKADNAKDAENDHSAKIVMVTAYDYTMARLVDRAGVDMVLVGDSLGMVVQGRENTLPVTIDEMIYHVRCVSRGLKRAHLVADMPFMSYQVSPDQALISAGRFIQEAGAESVKLEGGERSAPAIARCVEAGIPVVGHIGLTPQSVHAMGGFKVQGRSDAAADRLIADAKAVADAGAFSLVLEGIPTALAARITEAIDIPTIGIGAGKFCDGQVLVCNDILGMDLAFKPRFVKRYAELETTMIAAFEQYAGEVRDGSFPGPEHSFGAKKGPKKIARLY